MSVFILHTTFLNWWETPFIYLLIHRMICIRVTHSLSLSHGGWHPKKERKKDRPERSPLECFACQKSQCLAVPLHFISPSNCQRWSTCDFSLPWYPYVIQQAGNKNTCRTTCRLKVVISIWHQILARTRSCTFLQWSTNPILAWESESGKKKKGESIHKIKSASIIIIDHSLQ